MSNVTTGVVKWFNDTKGFGFIQQDSGPDVFAHFKEIATDGFKTLHEGQRVSLNIVEGKKCPSAFGTTCFRSRFSQPFGSC